MPPNQQEPERGIRAEALVGWYGACHRAIEQMDSRRQRRWVGPWSFHGAFKVLLVHQMNLWDHPATHSIVLPMGGVEGQFSFEGGWDELVRKGVVKDVEPPHRRRLSFRDGMRRTHAVHEAVQRMAQLVSYPPLHVNSGIYLMGNAQA